MMKRGVRPNRRIIFLICAVLGKWSLGIPAMTEAETVDAAGDRAWSWLYLYDYLGNHPTDSESTGWHDNSQGVAHDDDYWYVTDTTGVYRIYVGFNLSGHYLDGALNTWNFIGDIPELSGAGYNHFGDPEYYNYNGSGFLIMPIEGGSEPGFAAFEGTHGIAYIDHDTTTAQDDAPWCAVDADGYLYSSNFTDDGTSIIRKYSINWSYLVSNNVLQVTYLSQFYLLDESGNGLHIADIQGGCFSPDGSLLFINHGFYDWCTYGGVHVFDMETHRRVARSTNGSGLFDYEYHPCWDTYEEPEGLTYWDLDDGRAPGIAGQLHVIMSDQDWPSADDLYFKHYREWNLADVKSRCIFSQDDMLGVDDVAVEGHALVFGSVNSKSIGSDAGADKGLHVPIFGAMAEAPLVKDRGRSALRNGLVTIHLDPVYRGMVVIDEANPMTIRLTPTEDCQGIYVAAQDNDSFSVRELNGGVSSASFNWEVGAVRKESPKPELQTLQMPQD